jgi:Arc/MetJ-type ribon-helix-helix transcriptional regulator
MSYMSGKVVVRSVRLEQTLDQRIEHAAVAQGISVSAFIRQTLADMMDRDARRDRLVRALTLANQLPEANLDRDEMWGIGTRVPG